MKRVRYEQVLCDHLVGEEWKPVVGYESVYEVSNLGRVKRILGCAGARSGKILKQHISGHDYLYVMLCYGGKNSRKRLRVNRLVAKAFLGECPPGMQVNHKDGVKINNRVDNLEYMTPRENTMHFHANNLQPTCKLNPDSVRLIRASGDPVDALAMRFGVGKSTIYDIRRGVTWKRVI